MLQNLYDMRLRILRSICVVCFLSLPFVVSATQKESLFSWSANATLTSNYIWRGLYCGGPSLQMDATVSYAGVFANMWWNVGAMDWSFQAFNPEVDVMIGFSRWGLNVSYLHCFYFDHYADGSPSRFFDFRNHAPGGGGTTGEWRVSYTHAIPIRNGNDGQVSALVACRTFSRDGYYEEVKGENGKLKRAYSTYIELGYDQQLGEDWTLAARLGATPAKSMYTGFKGNFAVMLVGLKLNKAWQMGQGVMVNAFANLMLQPWQVNKYNLIMPIERAGEQKLNVAVECSVGI